MACSPDEVTGQLRDIGDPGCRREVVPDREPGPSFVVVDAAHRSMLPVSAGAGRKLVDACAERLVATAGMLIRDVDCDEDPDRWRAFLVDQGFGHFVAAGRARAVPVVVPTQYVLTDDRDRVPPRRDESGVRRRSRRTRGRVMSVAGDWAFIPGAWKAIGDEDPARGIPTTYYAAVQVTGECTIQSRARSTSRRVLETAARALDPDGEYVDPSEHGARLRAIRGIRMTIEDVRAKYKYGGNVDEAHRDGSRRAARGPQRVRATRRPSSTCAAPADPISSGRPYPFRRVGGVHTDTRRGWEAERNEVVWGFSATSLRREPTMYAKTGLSLLAAAGVAFGVVGMTMGGASGSPAPYLRARIHRSLE